MTMNHVDNFSIHVQLAITCNRISRESNNPKDVLLILTEVELRSIAKNGADKVKVSGKCRCK